MIKLKFPKSVLIGSTRFQVETDKSKGGASFQYAYKNEPATIKIGTRELKSNPVRTLELIIHECSEIVLYELGCRFEKSDESLNYVFHFDHTQFAVMCSMLAGIMEQFIVSDDKK